MSVSQAVTRNKLNALQTSTDLYQTCHQGRVPAVVVTYCFWWKSERRMSANRKWN